MRLICSLSEQKKAQIFSHYLTSKGIENKCEVIKNQDWGSDKYGDISFLIWILSEDQVDDALHFYDEFLKNPDNPQYHTIKIKDSSSPIVEDKASVDLQKVDKAENIFNRFGVVTTWVVTICILLFLPNFYLLRSEPKGLEKVPSLQIYASKINEVLMFDYPFAFQLLEKLVSLYGAESINNPSQLPPEGQYLFNEFSKTTYWQGIYPKIVSYFKDPQTKLNFNAPMFEKISQGQYWRFFTPAFLHFDFLHILFNMIWAIVLGQQIEKKIGSIKYILLIAISAIITNTAQYLMSGPFFIGYSGVVFSLIMFIVARKRIAVWEGYLLHRSTILFVSFFVISILLLQVVFFFLEVSGTANVPLRIANTAHITGGIVGYCLGLIPFFSWKN